MTGGSGMPINRSADKPKRLEGREFFVVQDPIDIRDRPYQPRLFEYPISYKPEEPRFFIRDQIVDGPCTGYALAAVIDMQNQQRARLLRESKNRDEEAFNLFFSNTPETCSARMLYEHAKAHDEFTQTNTGGDVAEGSSLRGAIKGFYHHGVAPEDEARDSPLVKDWPLDIARAKLARNVMLGSYYRVEPELNLYHSAIAEVGAILVSAQIHKGWMLKGRTKGQKIGQIEYQPQFPAIGGHAFAIIGYDSKGFIILNSWGDRWGGYNNMPGIAHWSYRDWAANVMDAWVLRLGVPTPENFEFSIGRHGIAGKAGQSGGAQYKAPSVPVIRIQGHYANIDDGEFVSTGTYQTPIESIATTAEHLAKNSENKYDGIVIFAHGGLNSIESAVARISTMRDGFKRNRLYPFFLCWNTGLGSEAMDILERIFEEVRGRTGSYTDNFFDGLVEWLSRVPGRALWREMQRGAVDAFVDGNKQGAGLQTVKQLIGNTGGRGKSNLPVHLIGHSAGAILLGEMIRKIRNDAVIFDRIRTVSLLAPACKNEFFRDNWLPLAKKLNRKKEERFSVYNLSEELEKADNVALYRKSLLYLVSNALETPTRWQMDGPARLTGLQEHSENLRELCQIRKGEPFPFDMHFSSPTSKVTRSTTHGGFDEDPFTMNHILGTITGKTPSRLKPFRENELRGL